MITPRTTPKLAAALLLLLCSVLEGQELKPSWNGTQLRVAAPGLRFLTGRGLEMIRNGRAVTYDFQLSVSGMGFAARRAVERFVISYDLWEERYSVTRQATSGSAKRTASHLTETQAEAWCVEQLVLATEGLPADKPFSVALEVRAQDTGQQMPEPLRDSGISLSALIEIFSRPPRGEQQRWRVEHPPVRLDAIRSRS